MTVSWWVNYREEGRAHVGASRALLRDAWLNASDTERSRIVSESIEKGELPEETLHAKFQRMTLRREGLEPALCRGCNEPLPAGGRPDRTTCSPKCRKRFQRSQRS